jgi:hypothetical protein
MPRYRTKNQNYTTVYDSLRSSHALDQDFTKIEELRPIITRWPCFHCSAPAGSACLNNEGYPTRYWHGCRAVAAGVAEYRRGVVWYHKNPLGPPKTAQAAPNCPIGGK